MKKTPGKIARTVGYAINILLAAITVASAFGGVVNPDVTVIPALLSMTFPVWFLLMPIVTVADLLTHRRMAFIPLFTMAACIGAAFMFCPVHFHHELSAEEKENSFTVLTYNTYGCSLGYNEKFADQIEPWPDDYNPLIGYILRSDADIVFMQETYGNPTRYSDAMHIRQAQADSLRAAYPYQTKNCDDLCILSKFPLEKADIKFHLEPYDGYECAWADIRGVRTLIVSAHMASIGLGDDDKELYYDLTEGDDTGANMRRAKRQLLAKLGLAFRHRARQARQLAHKLDSIGAENVIVAGDFNDIQGCYALRTISRADGGLREAYTDAGLGPTITYYFNRFYFRIDHILYRGRFKAVDARSPRVKFSDHFPLEATFVITDKEPSAD